MYTKDDKELNPRERQVEKPKNADELSLTLVVECHKYLVDKGENTVTYCHILAGLLPNPRHACKYEKVRNPEHLQRQIKYILSEYKARNRKNPYAEQEVEGALDFAKREFARRMINPFLNDKIVQNGDIFPKHIEHSGLYEDVASINEAILGLENEIKRIDEKLTELSSRIAQMEKPAYDE